MNAPIGFLKSLASNSLKDFDQHSLARYESSTSSVPSWLDRLLESVAYGIIICDRNRKVIIANQAAITMMEDCGESVSIHSMIPRSMSGSGERLYRALVQGSEGWRRMVTLDAKDGSTRSVSISPLELDNGERGMLVTTERVAVCTTATLVTYADLYLLTAAETRVLLSIAKGISPQEAADELFIAVTTVRSHIKSILHKTKADCIRSLLVRMAKLPPVVGLG